MMSLEDVMENASGDQLDKFISSILDEKGLTDIDSDVRAEMANQMRATLVDQIDRAVIEAMDEQYIDELNDLLDRNPDADDAEVQAIVEKSGADVNVVAARTIMLFRELYLGNLEPTGDGESKEQE